MLMHRLRTRRWRLRVAVIAVLTLLCQQFALAAHPCNKLTSVPDRAPPMAACHDMTMPETATEADTVQTALCDQHCIGDQALKPDLSTPQVPLLALPLFDGFASTLLTLPALDGSNYRNVPLCRSDPPPIRRFCSLQI